MANLAIFYGKMWQIWLFFMAKFANFCGKIWQNLGFQMAIFCDARYKLFQCFNVRNRGNFFCLWALQKIKPFNEIPEFKFWVGLCHANSPGHKRMTVCRSFVFEESFFEEVAQSQESNLTSMPCSRKVCNF